MSIPENVDLAHHLPKFYSAENEVENQPLSLPPPLDLLPLSASTKRFPSEHHVQFLPHQAESNSVIDLCRAIPPEDKACRNPPDLSRLYNGIGRALANLNLTREGPPLLNERALRTLPLEAPARIAEINSPLSSQNTSLTAPRIPVRWHSRAESSSLEERMAELTALEARLEARKSCPSCNLPEIFERVVSGIEQLFTSSQKFKEE